MKDKNDSKQILDKINEQKVFTLEKFMKETLRKLNLHILSNNEKDCISFVEYLTKVTFQKNQKQLLMEQIPDKINLYSFMNYYIYDNEFKLMDKIIKKGQESENNLNRNNYKFSEVVIIIDNCEINDQINNIRISLKDKIFDKECFIPFFLFITPKNLDLSDFLETNIFQYKIILNDIVPKNEENNEENII